MALYCSSEDPTTLSACQLDEKAMRWIRYSKSGLFHLRLFWIRPFAYSSTSRLCRKDTSSFATTSGLSTCGKCALSSTATC